MFLSACDAADHLGETKTEDSEQRAMQWITMWEQSSLLFLTVTSRHGTACSGYPDFSPDFGLKSAAGKTDEEQTTSSVHEQTFYFTPLKNSPRFPSLFLFFSVFLY